MFSICYQNAGGIGFKKLTFACPGPLAECGRSFLYSIRLNQGFNNAYHSVAILAQDPIMEIHWLDILLDTIQSVMKWVAS